MYSQGYMPPVYSQQGYMSPVYPQQEYMPPVYPQQEYMPQSQSSQNTKSISFNMIIFVLIICLIIWLIAFRKNGKLSEWSEWSTCDKTCGGGTQTRKRTYTPSAFGGREDPDKDKLIETQPCNRDVCKIDGKMSDWADSGKCVISETDSTEITCGTGKRKQIRSYLPASNGGIEMAENNPERQLTTQWIECSKDPCPNAPGSFTTWIDDSSICYKDQNALPANQVTCGIGYKKQTRTYIPPRGNGQDLSNKTEVTQWVSCGTLPECPAKVDATCSDYIWDAKCVCDNNLYKIGKQKIKKAASGGGVDIYCDTTRQEFNCNSNTITAQSSNLAGLSQDIKNTFTPRAICPHNGILSDQPIESACTPNIGKNRTKTKTYNYTFPLIRGEDGKHDTNFERMFSGKIADINNMGSNSTLNVVNQLNTNETYIFSVTNSTEPKQYRLVTTISCPNVPITPEETIMSLWTKNTGCSQALNNNIYNKIGNTLEDLKFKTTNDINTSFQQFTKNSLASNTNNENIKLCYGDNGYLIIDDSNKLQYSARSILRAGFNFNKGITILSNGSYELVFQSDGNLVMYQNNQIRWSNTGKCFDVDGGNTANGTKVQTWDCNSNNNQKFVFQNSQIKWNNKCLDVAGGSTSNGTKVQIWDCANVDAQKFLYQNSQIKWNNKCLDVDGGNTANGTQIQIWDCDSNNNNQKFILGGDARWASNTLGKGHTLVMQHDGNLVIYNTSGTAVWNSDTSGNNNAYLELEDTGTLYIKNSNGVIIKYLRDPIRGHLTSSFWNNSPDAVFSDKKGRFFPFKWNDSAVMTDNLLDPSKFPSDDCCGDYNQFRGWFRSMGDSPWDERELNLLNIYNYSQITNGAKPVKDDNAEFNYNSSQDRKNFYYDLQSNAPNGGVRKPPQFKIGGIEKPNYLPGYTRISYVDGDGHSGFSYKFLIMSRGSSKYNQAFVMYKKIQDRDAFATDIINNHQDIIDELKKFFRNN